MSNVVLSERWACASFHKNLSDTKTWCAAQRRLRSSGRSSEMKAQPTKAELGPVCAKEALDGLSDGSVVGGRNRKKRTPPSPGATHRHPFVLQ